MPHLPGPSAEGSQLRDAQVALAVGPSGEAQEVTGVVAMDDEIEDGPWTLLDSYRAVRRRTEQLTDGLYPEDMTISSMPDVSPTKWHLAHTTWFFEQFVLLPAINGYNPYDEQFFYLFNSYYVQAGERHCRAKRGLVSRPTVEEVISYRRYVDAQMVVLLQQQLSPELERVVRLGIEHEKQHQELLITDIKHVLWTNPLQPAYTSKRHWQLKPSNHSADFVPVVREAGTYPIGRRVSLFDNETPLHTVWQEPYELADRLVTNEDYLQFILDSGYKDPKYWLSAGWTAVQAGGWKAPLYWSDPRKPIREYTLAGWHPLDFRAPVAHVSYYEADAYARWAGARLPTEFEMELALNQIAHPFHDAWKSVWQWTSSPYIAYPGYKPVPGPLGEYNGKFMSDQWVLKGGSIATPLGASYPEYRNFFPADARWQFTGIRLARDYNG